MNETENMEKILIEIARAVEQIDIVKKIEIKIQLEKAKPDKEN